MSSLIDPSTLTDEQIELIERLSMRFVYQAVRDFALEAVYIFANSPDDQTEVAEDTTREALGRLPGFPIPARIFGVMDFKRAGYTFLPEFATRQALLVDSKAEKASNVARLQTSQTSLRIRQVRQGQVIDEPGRLDAIMSLHGNPFLTTTIFVHYNYEDRVGGGRSLKNITLAALPNGRLQRSLCSVGR